MSVLAWGDSGQLCALSLCRHCDTRFSWFSLFTYHARKRRPPQPYTGSHRCPTPIFCRTERNRGFIGHIGGVTNHLMHCTQDRSASHGGVWSDLRSMSVEPEVCASTEHAPYTIRRENSRASHLSTGDCDRVLHPLPVSLSAKKVGTNLLMGLQLHRNHPGLCTFLDKISAAQVGVCVWALLWVNGETTDFSTQKLGIIRECV